jgi:carboxymethylenebutenolidase
MGPNGHWPAASQRSTSPFIDRFFCTLAHASGAIVILELNQYQEYLVHEFVDDYQDGVLSRRDMVGRVLHITGGVAAAATMLTSLGVRAADAMNQATPGPGASTAVAGEAKSPLSVPPDDPSVQSTDIQFPNGDATITAYEARPAGGATPQASSGAAATPVAGGLPLVLVCHENRGLTDHIKDVTRRLAKQGYVACAVDLLSREGGTAKQDPSQVPSILSNADPNRHVSDFAAALKHYQQDGGADAGRAGMTGFCFGGGITWRAATQIADLKAAVPWYGPPPPLDAVPDIKAAVFGIYSSDPGDFANKGRDELEQALKTAGVTYQMKVYPGTQHAFNNDTGPRYNEQQALAAWQDMLAWFGKYLA